MKSKLSFKEAYFLISHGLSSRDSEKITGISSSTISLVNKNYGLNEAFNKNKLDNYRFNKNHETWNVAQILTQYENNFEDGEMTDFPRKFNQSYENYDYLMNIKNTFQAYKEYLNTKWKVETKKGNVPMWTKRNKPEFYIA